jgi:hypothetical protein
MINVNKGKVRMEGTVSVMLAEIGTALAALKRGMVRERGMPEELFDMMVMSMAEQALAEDMDGGEYDVFLMKPVVSDRAHR